MKSRKLRAVALLVAILGTALLCARGGIGISHAVEFSVTQSNAVLYTTGNTKVYSQPDTGSSVVTTLSVNVPVQVSGVTSNGWFEVYIEGTYYIQGEGLSTEQTPMPTTTISTTDIETMTKGTFSFYKNTALSKFGKDDIEDMDENTYIKYLDSYLKGYALVENCILVDSGKTLKNVYSSQSGYASMQAYLIDYRNNYFGDSLIGPFRSEKELKKAINRAIRYDISEFNSAYKNSNISSSDDDKMDELVKGVLDEIDAEQGVDFSYKIEYGSYRLSDGSEGKGWIISFTRKD